MRKKFWELAGSKLGNILGVEKQAEEEDVDKTKTSDDGNVDYRNDSQYSTHLQKKLEAVSEFAKSKSIRDQRAFLPIFTCREQLMRVIQDHNGNN